MTEQYFQILEARQKYDFLLVCVCFKVNRGIMLSYIYIHRNIVCCYVAHHLHSLLPLRQAETVFVALAVYGPLPIPQTHVS